MKQCGVVLLALSLCASLLTLPALAASTEEEAVTAPAYLAPVQVWGQASWLESGSLFLKNSSEGALHQEIIIHMSENTPIVDAVSGLPMEASRIKEGDTVYAWVGPAMTMSLPPQTSAALVVANIPADFAVPQYYEVAFVKPHISLAIYPPPPLTKTELVTTSGESLTVTDKAELTPYRTRQMVRLESLVPGSSILVWRDQSGAVSRVLLFPYAYQGYVFCDEAGGVFVNDQRLKTAAKTADGDTLLPIRAVAEAAGYQVDWVDGKGAVVSENGKTVFSVLPGAETALTAEDEAYLGYPCVLEKGVTYLRDADLARLLNLFLSKDA